jgi:transportin-1
MIVALDLVSGMSQGMGTAIEPLLTQSQPPFIELLCYCLKDNVPEVRQSSFALVGDLAIACFHLLKPYLPTILPIIIQHCNHQYEHNVSVCNNASWASGEISLRYGQEIQPYTNDLLQNLIPLLNNPELPRTLHENAAITLGRMAITVTDQISPHLGMFSENWCKALRHTRDNEEKQTAFLGFCKLLQRNPEGCKLEVFCEAVASWNYVSDELRAVFKGVLDGYKDMLKRRGQWDAFRGVLNNVVLDRLRREYQFE